MRDKEFDKMLEELKQKGFEVEILGEALIPKISLDTISRDKKLIASIVLGLTLFFAILFLSPLFVSGQYFQLFCCFYS